MDQERALELYKIFRQESSVALAGYHYAARQYLTLITAILGTSIAAGSAAMTRLGDYRELAFIVLLVVGLIGPWLNVVLCWLAVSSSDRAYQTFLEAVTINAKLEALVGLVGERSKGAAGEATVPFPDDESILPDRWLEYQNYSTAQEFVKDYLHKGSSQVVHRTFALLAITNIVLSVCAVVCSLLGLCGVI